MSSDGDRRGGGEEDLRHLVENEETTTSTASMELIIHSTTTAAADNKEEDGTRGGAVDQPADSHYIQHMDQQIPATRITIGCHDDGERDVNIIIVPGVYGEPAAAGEDDMAPRVHGGSHRRRNLSTTTSSASSTDTSCSERSSSDEREGLSYRELVSAAGSSEMQGHDQVVGERDDDDDDQVAGGVAVASGSGGAPASRQRRRGNTKRANRGGGETLERCLSSSPLAETDRNGREGVSGSNNRRSRKQEERERRVDDRIRSRDIPADGSRLESHQVRSSNHAAIPVPTLPAYRRMTRTDQAVSTNNMCCMSGREKVGIRWFVIFVGIVGLTCVIVGIVLGVLGGLKVAGVGYVTISLLLIGVGMILTIVSGVAWRLTSPNSLACPDLLHLTSDTHHEAVADEPTTCPVAGDMNIYSTSTCLASSPPHPTTLLPTSGMWYPHTAAATSTQILFPEFRYRQPPPTYERSMLETRLGLLWESVRDIGGGRGNIPGRGVINVPPPPYSHRRSRHNGTIPGSPQVSLPPSYRSRDSSDVERIHRHSRISIDRPTSIISHTSSIPVTINSNRNSNGNQAGRYSSGNNESHRNQSNEQRPTNNSVQQNNVAL